MLGVLGQATLNFVAVTTLLFCCFCVCPKFCDLAKQRRKMFLGVSEVGKIDFAVYFFWLCVFFSVFSFLLLRSRGVLLSCVDCAVFQRLFLPTGSVCLSLRATHFHLQHTLLPANLTSSSFALTARFLVLGRHFVVCAPPSDVSAGCFLASTWVAHR